MLYQNILMKLSYKIHNIELITLIMIGDVLTS